MNTTSGASSGICETINLNPAGTHSGGSGAAPAVRPLRGAVAAAYGDIFRLPNGWVVRVLHRYHNPGWWAWCQVVQGPAGALGLSVRYLVRHGERMDGA